MTLPGVLRPLAERPDLSAILLDYDGTLAEIVNRPEDAVPAPSAVEAVRALVGRYALVAVISGRPTDDVAAMLGVPGVTYLGQYGFDDEMGAMPPGAVEEADAIAQREAGVRAEHKGDSVAIHYRLAPDPSAVRDRLARALGDVAARAGLDVIEGKMVVELVPAGMPRKDGAVKRLVGGAGARAAMYAGDDVADLEAFAALDELAGDGLMTVKVAVRGPETPQELVDAADLAVEGPSGLVALLRDLAS